MGLSTFYSVAISTLSGPADSDGFIDNKKIEQYMAAGSVPTTVSQSITKERANSRFEQLTQTLGVYGNMYMTNVTLTGGNAISAPSAISFVVEVERGDSVLTTPDESNVGQTLTGANCLKRFVARSLLVRRETDYAEYYDPTLSNAIVANGATVAAARVGPRIEKISVGKLANTIAEAEAVITVTKINI